LIPHKNCSLVYINGSPKRWVDVSRSSFLFSGGHGTI
jgi:hypothetical protein